MRKKHPVEELIEQGEHQQLDFKFEVNDSQKIARSLSAFANTDGGRLLIGVKDNGHISGVRSEEEYYMIEAASKMYTKPEVPFEATRWDVNGKTVLEIYIAPSSLRPHLAPDKDGIFKAYIRVKDENMLANDILVRAWRKGASSEGTLLMISKPVERLFNYLETHDYISLKLFCRVGHIPYKVAKSILIDLLAADILDYVMINKHICYRKK